jgi:hypothetical protein
MSRGTSALALATALSAALLGGCIQVTRTTPAASQQTTIIVPPGTSAAVVQTAPWCEGAYTPARGTNLGACTAPKAP